MILPDLNLLLYAFDVGAEYHNPAKEWLESALSSSEQVGFAWVVLLAFIRITTNPRVLASPLLLDEATDIVSNLLQRWNAVVLHPGERHWDLLRPLVIQAQARGNLVTDAHLAALAIEHGAVVCTTDRDFARFPGLRWRNPLEG